MVGVKVEVAGCVYKLEGEQFGVSKSWVSTFSMPSKGIHKTWEYTELELEYNDYDELRRAAWTDFELILRDYAEFSRV